MCKVESVSQTLYILPGEGVLVPTPSVRVCVGWWAGLAYLEK